MFAKRLTHLTFISLILGALILSSPMQVNAQGLTLCGEVKDYESNGWLRRGFFTEQDVMDLYQANLNDGFYHLYDVVISPVDGPVYNGTPVTKQITSFSSYKTINGFQDCAEAPTQEPPTSVPPTRTPNPPTFTPVPTFTLIPPTSTPIPTYTPVPPTLTPVPTYTSILPSLTPILPTPKPIATQIVPSPVAQNGGLALKVTPIDQRIPAGAVGRKMKSGQTDEGTYNCLIASTAMVLNYLKSQGILDNYDTTSYLSIRDVLRSKGKYTDPNIGMGTFKLRDSIPELTNKKLTAKSSCIPPEHFEETILNELNANRPVIAVLPQWGFLQNILPGHVNVIYGLRDRRLLTIDPMGGTFGEIPIKDYIKDKLWGKPACSQDSPIIITFAPTN